MSEGFAYFRWCALWGSFPSYMTQEMYWRLLQHNSPLRYGPNGE